MASSQDAAAGQLAVKAVDGWPHDGAREWASDGAWLKLAWPSPVSVSRIVLCDRPNLNDQITAATCCSATAARWPPAAWPTTAAPSA